MATAEMPCGKVPVLFTTWHLWVFSSVKSEIQQNTKFNGLLTVHWGKNCARNPACRISSAIFRNVRMAAFVHSLYIHTYIHTYIIHVYVHTYPVWLSSGAGQMIVSYCTCSDGYVTGVKQYPLDIQT